MTQADPTDAIASLSRGHQLGAFEVCVTADDSLAYLSATGADSDAWTSYVPPLAVGALALGGLIERVGIPEGLIHAGQEFDFIRPVEHGQPVQVCITVASYSERRGALIVAFDIELDAAGQRVGTGRTSIIIAPPEQNAVAS